MVEIYCQTIINLFAMLSAIIPINFLTVAPRCRTELLVQVQSLDKTESGRGVKSSIDCALTKVPSVVDRPVNHIPVQIPSLTVAFSC